MAVDGLITSSRTYQRFHLSSQHCAHAHRVRQNQFGEHLAKFARQVLTVLQHLPGKVFACQQCVEPCVGRSVYVCGQMLRQVVYTIGYQVFVQPVEDFSNGMTHRVALQQRIGKFVTHRYQLLCISSFKQQEYLILDFQVGKGQLRGAVLVLRRRHQFIDVLL